MSYRPRWDSGDWIAICDVCGRKFKASRLMKRWDGMMTCPDDWEPRQPQDFVRGVADFQAPPYTRPEPQDDFVEIHYTRNISDSIVTNDAIHKQVLKRLDKWYPSAAINEHPINHLVLNGSVTIYPTTGLDGTTADDFAITVLGAYDIFSDTNAVSDVVVFIFSSNFVLNGSALNSTILG